MMMSAMISGKKPSWGPNPVQTDKRMDPKNSSRPKTKRAALLIKSFLLYFLIPLLNTVQAPGERILLDQTELLQDPSLAVEIFENHRLEGF